MTKKNILIACFIFLLAGLSLYLNKDRFTSEVIQLSHRSIAPRGPAAKIPISKVPANQIIFLSNKSLKLNSVKVIMVADAETNKFPHAIWNLISESNSLPVKEFVYGAPIRGMHLATKGVVADQLVPGVTYRILAEAGPEKLQHDFIPSARAR